MRLFTTLAAALAAPALACAQDLGTKADPIASSTKFESGGPGILTILQTIVVLGVVLFLLKTAAPKLLAKWNKRIITKSGSQIRIEESATFAGGSLYVVEARGKTLLLSVGANGVTCLSDLTSDRSASENELPLFMELIEQETLQRAEDMDPPAPATYLEEATDAVDEPSPVAASLLRNDEIEALRRAHKLNA